MDINNRCKRCGKILDNGEGVNGLCDNCLTNSWHSDDDIEQTKAEQILQIMSSVTLIVGIILTIIFAFKITTIEVGEGFYSHKELSITGLAITLATLLSSICTWALLSCIAQMSINIRKIANSNK